MSSIGFYTKNGHARQVQEIVCSLSSARFVLAYPVNEHQHYFEISFEASDDHNEFNRRMNVLEQDIVETRRRNIFQKVLDYFNLNR